MKNTIKIILFILISLNISAQDKVSNNLMSWWNLNGEFKLSEKTSVSSMYSWRRSDFIDNWQQSLLRIGINYHLNEKFTITPGYDWVITFPYGDQPVAKRFTEHRFFEQFTLNQTIDKLNIKHRYRIEQRLFDNNSIMKNRFRYRFSLSIPIDKNKKASIQTFNEVFLNFANVSNNHYFDQNWIYVGFAYKMNTSIRLKAGLMNQYVLKSDNIKSESNPSIQVGFAYKMK